MSHIKKLSLKDVGLINNFISDQYIDFEYFIKLGWSNKSIKNQLKKSNNFSIGYFINNELVGLMIGDIVNYKNDYELEVYILFVVKKFRKNKIATNILSYINLNKKLINISKIYVEVAENNLKAIRFYKENNFVFFKFRHNYYKYKNKSIKAICLIKKYRDD